MNKTIFVSIASVDDQELVYCVDSIFKNASDPENIFVGIAFTGKYRKRIKELKKISNKYKNVTYTVQKQKRNNIYTLGTGVGRSRAYDLYKGQDYFLQVDSHSYFFKSWDKKMKDFFQEASKDLGTDKIVLTCIPPIYGYDADERIIRVGPKTRYPEWQTSQLFVDAIPKWSDFDVFLKDYPKFIPSVKANSAMMFGNKKFAKNIGVDSKSVFYDEELIHTYELFGRGMSLVFPNVENFPIAHLDSDRIVDGHGRTFFLDYLDENHNYKIHERLKEHYREYVFNPKNKSKIEKYKKYAKVDPLRGYFSIVKNYVPKDYK